MARSHLQLSEMFLNLGTKQEFCSVAHKSYSPNRLLVVCISVAKHITTALSTIPNASQRFPKRSMSFSPVLCALRPRDISTNVAMPGEKSREKDIQAGTCALPVRLLLRTAEVPDRDCPDGSCNRASAQRSGLLWSRCRLAPNPSGCSDSGKSDPMSQGSYLGPESPSDCGAGPVERLNDVSNFISPARTYASSSGETKKSSSSETKVFTLILPNSFTCGARISD